MNCFSSMILPPHIRTAPSSSAAAMNFPSGDHATFLIGPMCPFGSGLSFAYMVEGFWGSQMNTFPPEESVSPGKARYRPSGDHAIAVIGVELLDVLGI